MLRAIREIQPKWIVGENVLGILNWNEGLVFEQVQAEMESEGYEVQTYVLPACGVGAIHRRNRVFFVGHRYDAQDPMQHGRACDERESQSDIRGQRDSGAGNNERVSSNDEKAWSDSNTKYDGRSSSKGGGGDAASGGRTKKGQECPEQPEGICEPGQLDSIPSPDTERNRPGHPDTGADSGQAKEVRGPGPGDVPSSLCSNGAAADPGRVLPQGRGKSPDREETERYISAFRPRSDGRAWENFPTQPPVCGRNDGISERLDGITFLKWRRESIKGYGNAVVPQLIMQIFKAIELCQEEELSLKN